MTAKEFVLSVYPNARFSEVGAICPDCAIEISVDPGRYIGWCRGKNEKQTWEYARKDIEYDMMRKLENA